MSRIAAAAMTAMLSAGVLAAAAVPADAGFWHRRHAVVTPVLVAPVGVVGAAQLGTAYSDLRYQSYYPYYYHAPVYGYFHGPTYYHSRPAYFYGSAAPKVRRVAHRTKPHCNCPSRKH